MNTGGAHLLLVQMRNFTENLISSQKLVDIKPLKLVPTWRNDRSGNDSIARRLDRGLIVEGLLASSGLSRSWVEYPFISDHAPILIQLENAPLYKAFPFKFNSIWLQEAEFVKLVHLLWKDPRF
jgi:hypothetical protein